MPIFLTQAKVKRPSNPDRLTTEEKVQNTDINTEINNDIKTTENINTLNTNKPSNIGDDEDEGLCCICDNKKYDTMLECLVP